MRWWDGSAWTEHTATNDQYAQVLPNPSLPPGGVPTASAKATRPWTRRWQFWLIVVCVTFFGIGAIGNATTDDSEGQSSEASRQPPASDEPPPSAAATNEPTPSAEPTSEPVVLLLVTGQKDGDSWVASDGKEYRLGLVNTPETTEPCGPEATAFTSKFLSGGFTADAYSVDSHGRAVAEVLDESGRSLNVELAKSGLGNDRYLEQFRHENPDLGKRLDSALSSASRPACRKSATPVPLAAKPRKTSAPASNCMTGYSPCLPLVADLDCGEIGHPVRVTGSDPYRLDRDGDGTGCD
jgi:endonuclease YncB( thermonuclease family)